MGVYRNLETFEDSLNGQVVLTLARKSRQIVITNDSGIAVLQFKFNSSETYGTLKPTETISMEFITDEIYLSSDANVTYRVWSYG